jgi:hypothetical protein
MDKLHNFKKYLHKFLSVITFLTLITTIGHTQTTDSTFTFTELEVIKLDSLLQSYEQENAIQKVQIELLNHQLINYELLHQQDSLHINLINQNIGLLNDRITLYIDLTDQLKPKWYNKPIIHFFLGAVTITTSAIVLNQIK